MNKNTEKTLINKLNLEKQKINENLKTLELKTEGNLEYLHAYFDSQLFMSDMFNRAE